MFSFLSSVYLGMKWLGCMAIPYVIVQGTARLVSKVAVCHVASLPAVREGLHFFTSLLSDTLILAILVVWNGILLWFLFAFPCWLMMLRIFSCVYWPFVYLLLRSSMQILRPLLVGLFLLLSCKGTLYYTSLLSCKGPYAYLFIYLSSLFTGTWFANMFFHSVGSLCTFLIMFFFLNFLLFLLPSYLKEVPCGPLCLISIHS